MALATSVAVPQTSRPRRLGNAPEPRRGFDRRGFLAATGAAVFASALSRPCQALTSPAFRLGPFEITVLSDGYLTVPSNGLKREQLIASNSMILHELFFDGLGDESAPGSALKAAIEKDFGSYQRWHDEFLAMGKAQGGGSGWVLLTWSARDRRLTNQWAMDHTTTLAGGQPILALDMYEHSYHIDYGAKAATYVETFMKAIRWSNADQLFAEVASTANGR
jgi:superoxide dismutase, Fe-Mn family